MPSILVVEQEPQAAERIHRALTAEGWRVVVLAQVEQALRIAATENPDLVMVAADVPGAEILSGSFGRQVGGPGLVGLITEGSGARGLAADATLAKPFSDEDLVMTVRRAFLAHRPTAPTPAASDLKLTSQDIFGDVLAEVEAEPQPSTVRLAPPKVPLPPAPARPRDDTDVNRRLEETLSGVLSVTPRPRPAAPPVATSPPVIPAIPAASRRPEPFSENEVDALLSKTLSNLDIRRTGAVPVRPPAPTVAVPIPIPRPVELRVEARPDPAPTPRIPAAPPPPSPGLEGTGVRKPPRATGAVDIAELERLARTGVRTPTQQTPPPQTPPPAAPPPLLSEPAAAPTVAIPRPEALLAMPDLPELPVVPAGAPTVAIPRPVELAAPAWPSAPVAPPPLVAPPAPVAPPPRLRRASRPSIPPLP